jgi:hypothetical protein
MRVLRHVEIQVRIIDIPLCCGQQYHFTEGVQHQPLLYGVYLEGESHPWLEDGDKFVSFDSLDIK